ncbi:6-O-methylguanine DNA methyltransferase [Zopfochytrium polystomum]|nr:6-O-methylguanine DNA methyltransferase [Zopfochytrium polystomum]
MPKAPTTTRFGRHNRGGGGGGKVALANSRKAAGTARSGKTTTTTAAGTKKSHVGNTAAAAAVTATPINLWCTTASLGVVGVAAPRSGLLKRFEHDDTDVAPSCSSPSPSIRVLLVATPRGVCLIDSLAADDLHDAVVPPTTDETLKKLTASVAARLRVAPELCRLHLVEDVAGEEKQEEKQDTDVKLGEEAGEADAHAAVGHLGEAVRALGAHFSSRKPHSGDVADHVDSDLTLVDEADARLRSLPVDFSLLYGRSTTADDADPDADKAATTKAWRLKVYAALRDIPSGTTQTYSEIASAVGMPRAVRAVATAIGRNPVPLLVPCHRVLAKGGGAGGFSFRGGIEVKRRLLAAEGVVVGW